MAYPITWRTASSPQTDGPPPSRSAISLHVHIAVRAANRGSKDGRYRLSHHVEDRLLPLKQTVRHPLDRRFRSTYTSPSVQPTGGRRMEGIVAIKEVVAGQVFKGGRTSLRAGSASQVFARSGTASEDKDAGHGPEGGAGVGHAFKTGVRARARRRVRFPSASAAERGL